MSKIYLTIDDGPSEKFLDLADFLEPIKDHVIFFNRGDHMEQRPEPVIEVIKRGYEIANHAYSHRRFSTLSFEEGCNEIQKTEKIIDDLYSRAGKKRARKCFRFPYMDRGMGAALVETLSLFPAHQKAIDDLTLYGLGHVPKVPQHDEIEKKRQLQEFLKSQGFESPPHKEINIDWYRESEFAQSYDWLCTYSTSDWVLTARHKGRFGFHTPQDLVRKMKREIDLNANTAHIILAHDQAEIFESLKIILHQAGLV